MGKVLFLSIWMPIIMAIFAIARRLSDDKGRSPKWLAAISAAVFRGMWNCYDSVFKPTFGDGERTLGDGSGMSSALKGVSTRDMEKECLLEDFVDGIDVQAGKERR
jgi:hypothetical protein